MRIFLRTDGGGPQNNLLNPGNGDLGVCVPNDDFNKPALVRNFWKDGNYQNIIDYGKVRPTELAVGDDLVLGDVLPQWAALAGVSIQLKGAPGMSVRARWENGLAPAAVYADTESVDEDGLCVRSVAATPTNIDVDNNELVIVTYNPFIATSRAQVADRLQLRILTLPTDGFAKSFQIKTQIHYWDRFPCNKSGICPCGEPKVPAASGG